MSRPTLSMTVLALFVSAEKAQEIEGDLLEQAQVHGKLWYLLHLKLSTVLLALNAFLKEPAKILLFSYAVYELVLKLNWWLLRPLRWKMQQALDLQGEQVIHAEDLLNASIGFLIALALVKWLPRQGALVMLFVLAFMLGRTALLQSPGYALEILLPVLLPVLAGLLLMKWLELLAHRHEWSLGAGK